MLAGVGASTPPALRRAEAPVAALADLEHRPVEPLGAADRALGGLDRLAVEPAPPPWPISRRASLEESPNSAAISAGRWTVPPSAAELGDRDLVGQLAAHVDLVEARLGLGPRALAVEAVGEPAGELALGLDRRPALVERLAEQQQVVLAHDRVGDAHQLAEHLLRRVGDADVVAVGLAHLPHPVGAREDRHRQDRLRRLAVGGLHVAAEQQVELLVGAAELDVGLDRDRVVALEHRVEQLERRDRLRVGHPLGEVVALEQAGDREPPHQVEELGARHRPATRCCGAARSARGRAP